MANKSKTVRFRCDPRTKRYLEYASTAVKQSLSEFIVEAALTRCKVLHLTGQWKAKSPPPQNDARRKS
jgi:uncharacterized protein (DUF1778 family)